MKRITLSLFITLLFIGTPLAGTYAAITPANQALIQQLLAQVAILQQQLS